MKYIKHNLYSKLQFERDGKKLYVYLFNSNYLSHEESFLFTEDYEKGFITACKMADFYPL
ncbi:MAG: hypothetical protein KatS3mg104_2936 [Phycisphaerae bacterium]|nr:MAG: hypothetical protein KatS3mg104_2936 [Phycisphaerae bacterium]